MKKVCATIITGTMATLMAAAAVTAASAKTVETDSGDSRFTIVMKNETTNRTFEQQGRNADSYDTVQADFSGLPSGAYDVAVYKLNEAGGNTSLCASTKWYAQADDATYNVSAFFYMVPSAIEIKTTYIDSESIDVGKLNNTYTVALQNTETKEVFQQSALVDFDHPGKFTADVDGLTAGKYNVMVYALNEAGGNTTLCGSTQWTCEFSAGLTGKVLVDFYSVTGDVKVTPNGAREVKAEPYTIAMKNVDTGEVFQSAAKIDLNRYDTDYAAFYNLPAGTYNVVVYKLNADAGITSRCADTQWVNDYDGANAKVSFFLVPSELEVNAF